MYLVTTPTTEQLVDVIFGELIHDHSLTNGGFVLIGFVLDLLALIGENHAAGMTHDNPARIVQEHIKKREAKAQ